MNSLIPPPDPIPAAWEYFHALSLLVFPIHLLFMNFMLGVTAVSVYALLKGDDNHTKLGHDLAKIAPFTIAFTVNFGVASLLFLQVSFGNLFYTSSVLMAVYWLGVPCILIVAYSAIYTYDFKFSSLGKKRTALAALALLIFLIIPFILTNNMTLMLDPQQWSAYFGNRGGTMLSSDAVVFPRYLHFVNGGLAVGGLLVAILGRIRTKTEPEVGELAVRIGMGLFAWLTLLQIVDGFWFLASMPIPVKLLFVGEDPVWTSLLITALLLSLLALNAAFKRKVLLAAGLVFPLVYLMIFIRDEVRAGYVRPFFMLKALKVLPQYFPLVLLLATILGAVITITWMLRKVVLEMKETGRL